MKSTEQTAPEDVLTGLLLAVEGRLAMKNAVPTVTKRKCIIRSSHIVKEFEVKSPA